MFAEILDFIAQIITSTIDHIGYTGVFLLMLVESCGVPMPSEIIMPFSGFAVTAGKMNFWLVAILGALGNLMGSAIAYWIGWRGGRPALEKYGKYLLISHHDLNTADRWFARHGEATVFFSRLLPVVRTYISFPAGVAKMNFRKFSLYTFMGALPWCILFTWLGVKMGNNWELIREKLHNFDLAIIIGLVVLIGLYIWRHLYHRKKNATL